MGKVSTTLAIVDKSSATLDSIYNKLNKINNVYNKLNSSNGNSLSKANTTIAKSFDSISKSTSGLTRKLKALASAYLGVMGMRSMFQTSDTLTSADNKFKTLATTRYDMNGTEAQSFSQDTMEKIFNSAQSAATSYTDMMSNVAKSVTLAGNAFGKTSEQQINNAIKFQEIMAKSYALGGASAAEQASSMYQLVQALGSGRLQGDELRSVTEGAPLAAEQIEIFAQKLFKTNQSLKEMASQGLITSDIVVGAILDMEGKTDEAFKNINLTWGQLWIKFKNTVTVSFKPFLEKLREIGNSKAFQTIMDNISKDIVWIADKLTKLATIAQNVIDWIANHWEWFKSIFIAGLVAIGVAIMANLVSKIVVAIMTMTKAQLIANATVFGIALAIGLLVGIIVYLNEKLNDMAMAIGIVSAALGVLAIIIGILGLVGAIALSPITITLLIIIGIVLLLGGIFIAFTEQVMGGFAVMGAFIANIFILLWNTIAAFVNFFANVFKHPIASVQILFLSMVKNVLSFIATLVRGIENLINLIPGVEINITSGIDGVISDIENKIGKIKDESGWEEVVAEKDFIEYDQAYVAGAAKGAEWHNNINNALGSAGDTIKSVVDPNNIAKSDKFGKDVSDISNNTGSMAKSMELTEEDIKWLRMAAEKDIINKFTTAEIKVEMNNNNTISGTTDLDGLLTYLNDELKEQMVTLADGVYN